MSATARGGSERRGIVLMVLGLVLINLAVYWDVQYADFINFDDPVYVRDNWRIQQGITPDALRWAATAFVAGNWHPLTLLSHMADYAVFLGNPAGHHWTNLLFHMANTLLLFSVLRRLTGAVWRSALVAALFAVHPLHVESVAWISERKDVLSTFFLMLALLAYAGYTASPRPIRYAAVVLFFALGLMAKPMLVSFPFLLLLLDIWPLRRIDLPQLGRGAREWGVFATALRPLLREKGPLFVLAAASCAVTYVAQKVTGAVALGEVFSLPLRLSNAAVTYVTYVAKTLWPTHLAVFYPFFYIPWEKGLGAALLLAAITAAAVWAGRRHAYWAVGWFWYLGTLVPVIGIVQVGAQAMADRYTYIPSIGLFIAAVWGLSDLCARFLVPVRIRLALVLLLILSLGMATRMQVSYWANTFSLFGHALQVTDKNYRAHEVLGQTWMRERGLIDPALEHLHKALAINPGNAGVHDKIGVALSMKADYDGARSWFNRALAIQPDHKDALLHRGLEAVRAGNDEQAERDWRELLRLDPEKAEAHNNLGTILAKQGKREKALRHFRQAVALDPTYREAQDNLALLLKILKTTHVSS